jgi:hypothetical protein
MCKSDFRAFAHLARGEFFEFLDSDAVPAPMRYARIAPFSSGSLLHVNIIRPNLDQSTWSRRLWTSDQLRRNRDSNQYSYSPWWSNANRLGPPGPRVERSRPADSFRRRVNADEPNGMPFAVASFRRRASPRQTHWFSIRQSIPQECRTLATLALASIRSYRRPPGRFRRHGRGHWSKDIPQV